MNRLRFTLCVVLFIHTLTFQAHTPNKDLPYPNTIHFVKTTTPAYYQNHLPAAPPLPLARYYAGFKQKSSVFSKPLKLRFQLGKYLLLHLSYN